MQKLAPATRVLIYAGLLGFALIIVLAFARIVQELVLIYRETGSLLTLKPDTPAIRRFRRVNGLLFGSIQFTVGLAFACGAVWCSWRCFQNGNALIGKTMAFLGLPTALIVMFTSACVIRKSLHQDPAETDELLQADDILEADE
jgi:hypothetical protein